MTEAPFVALAQLTGGLTVSVAGSAYSERDQVDSGRDHGQQIGPAMRGPERESPRTDAERMSYRLTWV